MSLKNKLKMIVFIGSNIELRGTFQAGMLL